MPTNGFRLFKIFGITVYLHWSWLLVAVYEVQRRQGMYHGAGWNLAEYMALFAIVLLHEFGHALACRSVGGSADRIVLWPLGGVAYVSPPMRPGAMLWSIAAGPLVNVALLPFSIWAMHLPQNSDLHRLLFAVGTINVVLLLFNILPIYPLDGGKIVWALLWFVIGSGRALVVASVIGIIGTAGLLVLAIWIQGFWLGVVAAWAGLQAWNGLQSGRELRRRETLPRRAGPACPMCGAAPPIGPFWVCSRCRARFDAFEYPDACPACGTPHQSNTCLDCGARAPFMAWISRRDSGATLQ